MKKNSFLFIAVVLIQCACSGRYNRHAIYCPRDLGDPVALLKEPESPALSGVNLIDQDSTRHNSIENQFEAVNKAPVSTFSIDVDKASYTWIRNTINNNGKPAPGDVRIEEMECRQSAIG